MLEHSFATMQKEVGKSIRVLNENSTITSGLLQTLVQESKQTGLRLDKLETKFDAHSTILNEHTSVLNGHTTLLNEHTTVLNDHSTILNGHTALLNDHTSRFDRVEMMLTEILERLPEKA